MGVGIFGWVDGGNINYVTPSLSSNVISPIVSSTRKLISSSSFHRLDMTLAFAEALNPNKPNC